MAKKKIDQKNLDVLPTANGEWGVNNADKASDVGPASKKGSPQFGSAEGKFVMADDFEETPEDFDQYVE